MILTVLMILIETVADEAGILRFKGGIGIGDILNDIQLKFTEER